MKLGFLVKHSILCAIVAVGLGLASAHGQASDRLSVSQVEVVWNFMDFGFLSDKIYLHWETTDNPDFYKLKYFTEGIDDIPANKYAFTNSGELRFEVRTNRIWLNGKVVGEWRPGPNNSVPEGFSFHSASIDPDKKTISLGEY